MSEEELIEKINNPRWFASNKRKVIDHLQLKYGDRCFYCAVHVCNYNYKYRYNIVLEHMTPVSRGGTNTLDNLVVSCFSCNSIKRSMDAYEYLLSDKYKDRNCTIRTEENYPYVGLCEHSKHLYEEEVKEYQELGIMV